MSALPTTAAAAPLTPFPWGSMLALSVALMAQGVAVTSVFPYIGFMITDFGVASDPDHAGFYAGYVTSAFMAGRAISSYFWGTTSDRIGRKPVLLIALVAIAGGSITFGLSKTLWVAVITRFITGMFNGIIAVGRTCISEICGPEHEVHGMGFLTGSWSVSFVIGPSVGGLLANLAKTYPDRFAADGVVARYPYLAPNLVAAAVSLSAIPLIHFLLPETRFPQGGKATKKGGFSALPQGEEATAGEKNAAVAGAIGVAEQEDPEVSPGRHRGAGAGNGNGTVNGGYVEGRNGDTWLQRLPLKAKNSGRCLADFAENDPAEAVTGAAEQSRAVELVRLRRAASGDGDASAGMGTAPPSAANGLRERTSLSPQRTFCNSRSRLTSLELCDSDDSDCGGGGGGGGGLKGGNRSNGDAVRGGNSRQRRRRGRTAEARQSWSETCGCGTLRKLLGNQHCVAVLAIYTLYSLLSIAFDEVYPLWCISSVANGGLGWDTGTIGQVLSLTGICLVVFQFLVFPVVTKWLGVVRSTRICTTMLVPFFAVFPFVGRLQRRSAAAAEVDGGETTGTGMAAWLAVLALLVGIKCLSNVVFSSLAVVTNNAVSTEMRGSLNGLAMTVGSIAKGTGPPLGATIFAASLSSGLPNPFDYHLVFYLLSVLILAVGCLLWRYIPEDMVTSQDRQKAEETEALAAAAARRQRRRTRRDDKMGEQPAQAKEVAEAGALLSPRHDGDMDMV